jgi:hypothetical protein
MKKLIASVLFISAAIGFTSCSSDDNTPIRKEASYEGTWVTDSLFYKAGNFEGKHLFSQMPPDDTRPTIIEEILTLTEKTASLVETEKLENGSTKQLEKVNGTINEDLIKFNGKEYHTDRIIVSYSDTRLELQYDITMRGATLPVTVTYKRK